MGFFYVSMVLFKVINNFLMSKICTTRTNHTCGLYRTALPACLYMFNKGFNAFSFEESSRVNPSPTPEIMLA